jgi:hypothetical protein
MIRSKVGNTISVRSVMKITYSQIAGGWIVAAVLGVVATSQAGQKLTQTVTVNTASRVAYGSLGSARASADTVQFIGCSALHTGATICTAKNSAGTSATCSTTDPAFRSAANSLNGDSRLEFGWNTSGACTYLQVENYSSWAPKQP